MNYWQKQKLKILSRCKQAVDVVIFFLKNKIDIMIVSNYEVGR